MNHNLLMRENFLQNYVRWQRESMFAPTGQGMAPPSYIYPGLNALGYDQGMAPMMGGNPHYCMTQHEYQTLLRLSHKYLMAFHPPLISTLPPRPPSSPFLPAQQLPFDDFYHSEMGDHLRRSIGDEATISRAMRHHPMAVSQAMMQQPNTDRYLEGAAQPQRADNVLPVHGRYNGGDGFFKEMLEMPKRGDWCLTENARRGRENEHEVQVWHGNEEMPFFKYYSGRI